MSIEKLYSSSESTGYSAKSSAVRFARTVEIMQNYLDLAQVRIADMGCGTGGLLNYFDEVKLKPKDYLGVEIRPHTRQIARYLHGYRKNCKFHDRLVGTYDIVVGLGVLAHNAVGSDKFYDDFQMLGKMMESAPLVVFTIPRHDYPADHNRIFRYSPEEIYRLCGRPCLIDAHTFEHEYFVTVTGCVV